MDSPGEAGGTCVSPKAIVSAEHWGCSRERGPCPRQPGVRGCRGGVGVKAEVRRLAASLVPKPVTDALDHVRKFPVFPSSGPAVSGSRGRAWGVPICHLLLTASKPLSSLRLPPPCSVLDIEGWFESRPLDSWSWITLLFHLCEDHRLGHQHRVTHQCAASFNNWFYLNHWSQSRLYTAAARQTLCVVAVLYLD